MRLRYLAAGALVLLVGCDLLASESADQEDPSGLPDQREAVPADTVEKIVVKQRYDTTDVRMNGKVAGMRLDVQELTPSISKYGVVNVMLVTDVLTRVLPWRTEGTLGELTLTFAYEPEMVYVLFLTKKNDVVRSALPTGEARVILTPPRDTVSRTNTDHRKLFFEQELKQIGFWEGE